MRGTIELPGDKSISHRTAMLASIATGSCRIRNFNKGGDCLSTLRCLRELGVEAEGDLVIQPVALCSPEAPLDCGNSASTIRMLTGLLAGQNVPATLIGDVSLLRRPMRRMAEPLRRMGAVIELRDEDFAPVILREGVKQAIHYEMSVPSAQVKSAILFAGINFAGMQVTEPIPTRDHTERLFEYLQLYRKPAVVPAFEYVIPGDPSAAAFFVVGALFREDSEIEIHDLLLNPYRVAYLRKLSQSGAHIEVTHRRLVQNELVGDVRVASGNPLRPIRISPEEVPSLIDEIPALSLLGTLCGFELTGGAELRHKESDRIEAMVANFQGLGVEAEETDDGFWVSPGRLGSGIASTFGDHRIAMTFAAAGIEIDDPDCVKVSFPEFFSLLNSLL